MNMYKINQINEFTYSLKIYGNYSKQIYNIILFLIKSSYFDFESNIVFFSAEKVIPLKEYILDQPSKILSYSQNLQLINDLSKQIIYLIKKGYGWYGFELNDIILIDNTFIICSTNYLLPIINEKLIFTEPIKIPYFSSPEIIKLTNLPSYINYKCIYYSLGTLIVFSYFNTYLLVGNEIKTLEEIENILYPIYNTKFYWFLIRCFQNDICKRQLLLV